MRRSRRLVIAALVVLGCHHAPPSLGPADGPDVFEPGAEWRDTNGARIEAHGGGILTAGRYRDGGVAERPKVRKG